MPCVYIIKSDKNGSYYIGSTVDLARRLEEHNRGKTPSTKSLVPWKAVYSQDCDTLAEARKIERKLKSFKSRIIIDRIVRSGKLILKI